MINLCLVVIATQFSETKQREHRLMLEQRQRYLSSSTVASYAEPGDCYEEIFQYICHILRKAKRRALGLYQAFRSRRQGAPAPAKPGPHAKPWGWGLRMALLQMSHICWAGSQARVPRSSFGSELFLL
jgi:voltage-dependent calcium channel T type alpha-1I